MSIATIPDSATIATEKIRDYLLVPKAKGDKSQFLGFAGYTRENFQALLHDLRSLLPNEATLEQETEFGRKYSFRAILKGPNSNSIAAGQFGKTIASMAGSS